MEINADFDARVLVHSDAEPWRPSPMAGVDRRMLDRIGEEVARATSIVRYAPGSKFSPHTHDGGEEFIVLSGVFQDEHGDFPAGTYVRNPPTSRHTPGSDAGCVIFVKLWQFDPGDRTQFRKDMAGEATPDGPGIRRAALHRDTFEEVSYIELDPGARLESTAEGGIELLMLDGSASEGGDALQQGSWLRLPDAARLDLTATDAGAKLWIKTGHLAHIRKPAA